MTVTPAATAWHELMTVQEVASVLRVSKMTVYRLVHDRKFDYPDPDSPGEVIPGTTRAGRSFRVRSAALDAYLRGSAVIT